MARLSYPPRAERRQEGGTAARLASRILDRAGDAPRLVVALAGPPGAGKSTLAEALAEEITLRGESAAVIPMDGFHYDDAVLTARGLLARKGAPETFDAAGFRVLLGRLQQCEPDVAIPVFDRSIEISRAGGAIVPASTRFLLVEGNYLLLDEEPWRALAPLFDLTVFIDVPLEELTRRLVRRWIGYGHSESEATARAHSNDIPNAERVVRSLRGADLVV